MEELPSLRNPATVAMLFIYLLRGCEREGFRIEEFSVQGNHITMLCEVDSKEALSRAMNGILCGMAHGAHARDQGSFLPLTVAIARPRGASGRSQR